MMGQPEPQDPAGGARNTPDDRATTFQAVQGPQAEHYSGEVLLVSAYALLWTIVLAWVAFMWRKQGNLNSRLTDLERVIDQADKARARGAAKATGSPG